MEYQVYLIKNEDKRYLGKVMCPHCLTMIHIHKANGKRKAKKK